MTWDRGKTPSQGSGDRCVGRGICLKPPYLCLWPLGVLLMLVDFHTLEGLKGLQGLMDLFLVAQEVRGTTRKAQLSTPAAH